MLYEVITLSEQQEHPNHGQALVPVLDAKLLALDLHGCWTGFPGCYGPGPGSDRRVITSYSIHYTKLYDPSIK